MRRVPAIALVAVLVATFTGMAGWIVVPLAAALGGALLRDGRGALAVGAGGAALGWLVLLTAARVNGGAESWRLAAALFSLPAWAVLLVTLLLAALLGGSAAVLAAALRPRPVRPARSA